MKNISGRDAAEEQDDLDALLTHAPRYTPPAGFAERVLASLHEEETVVVASSPRPWYLRPYAWGSAAAACAVAATCLFLLHQESTALPAGALAIDDALLVTEALDAIDDPDLISAICSVSTGAYSVSTRKTSTH